MNIRQADGVILVTLRGLATMVDTQILRDQLRELTEQPDAILVIDLSGLDFIGAEGIHTLLASREESVLHHGQIRLVHPNPEIKRMLKLIRLTEVFPIFDSVEDALRA